MDNLRMSASSRKFCSDRWIRCRHRSIASIALLVVAALGTALGGCSAQMDTHGERIEPERLAAVRPGVQNRDAVAQLLGSPSSTALFGEETWYYVSDIEETRSIFDRKLVDRQVVEIRFDQNGVVTEVDIFGIERGQEVEIVERETPSFGEDVNFVQQLLGNLGRFNRNETPVRR